jgi:hypothetical protein
MVIFSAILLALTLLLSFVHAVGPGVDLKYSKYRGKELGNGVTQWLGMRYASPPLKDLRFKPPKDPLSTRTVQDASDVSPFLTYWRHSTLTHSVRSKMHRNKDQGRQYWQDRL